jgi:acyl-CoA hydrolase
MSVNAEGLIDGRKRHVCSAFFVFVALDAAGKKRKVPLMEVRAKLPIGTLLAVLKYSVWQLISTLAYGILHTDTRDLRAEI